MESHLTAIQDCYIFEPKMYEDTRGYFFESFNQLSFEKATGIKRPFVQDNQSKSSYGVIRGLHAQKGEYAQAKLVRVLEGEVIDVAVDARRDSPTYGKTVQVKLSAENRKQLYIPRGCLHGFSVISPHAVFFYKCDNYYHKASEVSVQPLDSRLAIDWQVDTDAVILSEKDRHALSWVEYAAQNIIS